MPSTIPAWQPNVKRNRQPLKVVDIIGLLWHSSLHDEPKTQKARSRSSLDGETDAVERSVPHRRVPVKSLDTATRDHHEAVKEARYRDGVVNWLVSSTLGGSSEKSRFGTEPAQAFSSHSLGTAPYYGY